MIFADRILKKSQFSAIFFHIYLVVLHKLFCSRKPDKHTCFYRQSNGILRRNTESVTFKKYLLNTPRVVRLLKHLKGYHVQDDFTKKKITR